jgi:inorganic triphosphatase YgiF
MAAPDYPEAAAGAVAEIEAKLLLADDGQRRAIAGLERLGPYVLAPRAPRLLRSIYVDTADRALGRAAVALRCRDDDGRWELTGKWPGSVDGHLHARPELTVALAAAPTFPLELPAGPLRMALAAHVGTGALEPLLVTEVERRCLDAYRDHTAAGPRVAEIAVDRIAIRRTSGSAVVDQYAEVEIELVDGCVDDVSQLAESLITAFALSPSPETKFGRALRVLGLGA